MAKRAHVADHSSAASYILQLPTPLLLSILEHLPGEEVCRAALVGHSWRAAIDSAGDCFWQAVVARQFQAVESLETSLRVDLPPGCHSWQQLYAQRMVAGRNWLHGSCVRQVGKQQSGVSQEQQHQILPHAVAPQNAEALRDCSFVPPVFGGTEVCSIRIVDDILITGAASGDVAIWDLLQGVCVAHLIGHDDVIFTIDVDLGRTMLMTGSADFTCRVWSLVDYKCKHTLTMEVGSECIDGRLFPDDKVVTSSKRPSEVFHTITVWNLLTEQKCAEYRHPHIFVDFENALLVVADGKQVTLQEADGTIFAQLEAPITGDISEMFCHNTNGQRLLILSDQREVAMLDVKSRSLLSYFHIGHGEEVALASSSPVCCLFSIPAMPLDLPAPRTFTRFSVYNVEEGRLIGRSKYMQVLSAAADGLEFVSQQPWMMANVTAVLVDEHDKLVLWTCPSDQWVHLQHSLEFQPDVDAIAECSWRWLVVKDTRGVHAFDFLNGFKFNKTATREAVGGTVSR
eukprot:jgi/Chlat1/7672/Chrsp64S07128